ncbi:acetolactate decarboxylase [Aliirhizobium cellulosilyticum]|uniref:Alpha-acetolactate decarboxylase n=1 Tax=Aliirhizobium cellulosilyticum TaxID=393664 RepID=A0A7W6S907_9HYPH|nr:acetolactate decarboxylase [Rhizobium cellulosilyticum]MBB4349446.1 acetolactate decarboxylase [Rhizobium cellulosilyticum]MBB4412332.1 acetolactate decarboxylase [Rhizobium cellulosilyticum]MBB4446963.1 acetolactate decarboxylase [Rhizobium cellulosilyticum]
MDNIQPLSGANELIASASVLADRVPNAVAGEAYQTSLMSALVDGVYEGTTTYGDLHSHGDFGLGTFNDLDGEMVGFDGVFYQLRSDGSVKIVDDTQRTPFALVTFFQDVADLKLEAVTMSEAFRLVEQSTQANLFSAIRIDGRFRTIVTRTVRKQSRPFPPLQEAAKGQKQSILHDVEGTLAGFRTPAYAGAFGVPGFHLHFLMADRKFGGHVLDFEVENAIGRLCPLQSFHLELPDTSDFLKADLSAPDLAEKISAAEGGNS